MFDPKAVSAFRFLPHEFDASTGVARLHYAFDNETHFTEEFHFPLPVNGIDDANRVAIDNALFLLSLVAGVSYYKAAIPPKAIIESGAVTQLELDFLRELYFHGLGEFAYVNKVDLRDRPDFVADVISERVIAQPRVGRRSLVAVGGGKDSCVSIETMRSGGDEVLLASINRFTPIDNVVAASGLPSVHAKRIISPELLRLNNEGAYNGHVPVTAVVSLALVVIALMHECDAVVMSNEHSASVGNVEYNGMIVNHQYSKSLEAEALLAALVQQSIADNLEYFSLLRPFSELEITRRFSKMTRYHGVFTSCNKAFRLDETRRSDRWCGDCPKCRFVFLALAPFVGQRELVEIFGANLLDDIDQAQGFDELIGWDAFKPFECVGEVEESVAALLLLRDKPDWENAAIVKRFSDDILPKLILSPDVTTHPFVSASHHIPSQYVGLLDATA